MSLGEDVIMAEVCSSLPSFQRCFSNVIPVTPEALRYCCNIPNLFSYARPCDRFRKAITQLSWARGMAKFLSDSSVKTHLSSLIILFGYEATGTPPIQELHFPDGTLRETQARDFNPAQALAFF